MKFVLAAVLVGIATPSFGMTYFLTRDLGVQGMVHNCEYADGNTYTVNATELCPLNVNVDGIQSPAGSSGITGFKSGEYQDGMTKVCVYSVLGANRFTRVNSFELCPLTEQF